MIIGDGIHMSSDAISLILSLIAAVVATRASTTKRTFGYKRFEPIAAFINGLTLVLVPLYILYEAMNRMITPIDQPNTNVSSGSDRLNHQRNCRLCSF